MCKSVFSGTGGITMAGPESTVELLQPRQLNTILLMPYRKFNYPHSEFPHPELMWKSPAKIPVNALLRRHRAPVLFYKAGTYHFTSK